MKVVSYDMFDFSRSYEFDYSRAGAHLPARPARPHSTALAQVRVCHARIESYQPIVWMGSHRALSTQEH